MLKVETILKESPGRGLGLFAAKSIESGITVHIESAMEGYIQDSVVNAMEREDPIFYKFIKKYGTYHKSIDKWYLSLDDARFINHDEDANLTYLWYNRSLITSRAVKEGEELTCNYLYLCDDVVQNGLDFIPV